MKFASCRVLCTGSRGYEDEASVNVAMEQVYREWNDEYGKVELTWVHGACPGGADAIVSRSCKKFGYKEEKHPADWSLNGKSAGFIRNDYMVRQGADICLAFWDGVSNGTRDCFTRAVKAGIPVRVIPETKR